MRVIAVSSHLAVPPRGRHPASRAAVGGDHPPPAEVSASSQRAYRRHHRLLLVQTQGIPRPGSSAGVSRADLCHRPAEQRLKSADSHYSVPSVAKPQGRQKDQAEWPGEDTHSRRHGVAPGDGTQKRRQTFSLVRVCWGEGGSLRAPRVTAMILAHLARELEDTGRPSLWVTRSKIAEVPKNGLEVLAIDLRVLLCRFGGFCSPSLGWRLQCNRGPASAPIHTLTHTHYHTHTHTHRRMLNPRRG